MSPAGGAAALLMLAGIATTALPAPLPQAAEAAAGLEQLQVSVEPDTLFPGAPLRVRLDGLAGDVQVAGRLLDAPLTFMAAPGSGLVAFAGIDLDVKPGDYPLTLQFEGAGGPRAVTRTLSVTARDYPTEELTVEPKYVEPPAEVSERIAREAADLEGLWRTSTPAALYDGATVRPLSAAEGRNFGRRRVFNGQPRSPHSGTDLSAAEGTPVPAAAAGRVVRAREYYYSGNLVVLDHGGGVYTLYAHLSRLDVAEGRTVAAGEILGLVGATGRVTGAHLHWGGRIGSARVDPSALLELMSDGR